MIVGIIHELDKLFWADDIICNNINARFDKCRFV